MGGTTPGAEPRPVDRLCPWCSAPAPKEQGRCPSCGASLAQRETIDGLTVPGVTDVDPALVGLEGERRILTIYSERAGTITVMTPPELPNKPFDPATLGEPSEAVRRAVEHLDADQLDGPDRGPDTSGGAG